jgi:glutathione S-transferase
MKLVIGTKTYSSWSYRPWFMLVEAGIPFEEEVIPLRRPETAARIGAVSPNRKVPLLIDEDMKIWESIAILDHLADRFPEKGLWPADPAAKAHARAISAEMHASFQALRGFHPFYALRAPKPRSAPMPDAVMADLARVAAIWTEARALRRRWAVPLWARFDRGRDVCPRRQSLPRLRCSCLGRRRGLHRHDDGEQRLDTLGRGMRARAVGLAHSGERIRLTRWAVRVRNALEQIDRTSATER